MLSSLVKAGAETVITIFLKKKDLRTRAHFIYVQTRGMKKKTRDRPAVYNTGATDLPRACKAESSTAATGTFVSIACASRTDAA